MLRAVLFDLDGTLADTERQNAEAVARVLERAGRPLSDEEREFVIGHGWHEIYHHLVGNGGIKLGYEELMHKAGDERVRIVDEEGLDVLPGAVDTVRRLTSRYASAVVSGSSRAEVEAVLRALGVLELLPLVPRRRGHGARKAVSRRVLAGGDAARDRAGRLPGDRGLDGGDPRRRAPPG